MSEADECKAVREWAEHKVNDLADDFRRDVDRQIYGPWWKRLVRWVRQRIERSG